MRRILIGITALSTILALVGVATAPSALAKVKATDPTVYDSTVHPSPGNLPSLSYEATQTEEFGNQISFAGTARVLDNVLVQMSSWGCQSGNWTADVNSPDVCTTTPGATFTEPITLNIYNVGPASAYGPSTAGSLIVSDTQNFNIPYRPSADPNYQTDCAANATQENVPVSEFDGTWYDPALNSCFNGLLTDITFNFGNVLLPNNVIYGIAYDTSDYGASPNAPLYQLGGTTPTGTSWGDSTACHATTEGCGYDSLNLGLSNEPTAPSVGTDAYQGTVYWQLLYAPYYCDQGAAGTGTFRIDEPANYPTQNGTNSGCWSAQTNGDPITMATNVGTAVTITTSLSIPVGQYVDIYGTNESTPGNSWSNINGSWQVTSNTPPGTLTFNVTTAPSSLDTYTASSASAYTESPWLIPTVQFNAVSNLGPSITSVNSTSATIGTPFSFTVTTDGYPTPNVIKKTGRLPGGLTFTSGPNGTATISGTPAAKDKVKTYTIKIWATNNVGRARQTFTLTLSG